MAQDGFVTQETVGEVCGRWLLGARERMLASGPRSPGPCRAADRAAALTRCALEQFVGRPAAWRLARSRTVARSRCGRV